MDDPVHQCAVSCWSVLCGLGVLPASCAPVLATVSVICQMLHCSQLILENYDWLLVLDVWIFHFLFILIRFLWEGSELQDAVCVLTQ